MLVTVDGIEAICPKLNCGYTYNAPKAKITSQKLTGNVIEVEGTDLPVTDDVEVSISGTACSVNIKTATKVTCTLASTPTAGDWHVEVRDSEGRANPGSVAKISIPLIVNSVSPKSNINYYGGTVLTIKGTGFPLQTWKAKVKLDDGTGCKVLTSTSTEITCKLWKFKTVDSVKSFKVGLTVHKKTSETATIKQIAAVPKSVGVVPNTASPVLHTNLVITVAGGTLVKDKVFVELVAADDEDNRKPLYVIKSDAFKQEIKVKFGGAISGLYKLVVSTEADGRLDDGSLNF